MRLIRLGLDRHHKAHPDQLAFIEANNLSPADVLAGETAVVHDGTLTVHVVQRSKDGRTVLSDDGSSVLTKQVTVPLLSAPENHNL